MLLLEADAPFMSAQALYSQSAASRSSSALVCLAYLGLWSLWRLLGVSFFFCRTPRIPRDWTFLSPSLSCLPLGSRRALATVQNCSFSWMFFLSGSFPILLHTTVLFFSSFESSCPSLPIIHAAETVGRGGRTLFFPHACSVISGQCLGPPQIFLLR